MFLRWKKSGDFFLFDYCFSLNFGYYDLELTIPQISLTPESDTNLNYDSPSSCFFVIIGGKYLDMIGDVMEKVSAVTNDVGGFRPLAVFLVCNDDNKELIIDVKYGMDRYNSTPVMVIVIMNISTVFLMTVQYFLTQYFREF